MNSFILHTEKEKKPLIHYKFRETLVKSLSGNIIANSDIPSVDDGSAVVESSNDANSSVSLNIINLPLLINPYIVN